MKIRDWTTLGAMAPGAAGAGIAVKSLLPKRLATEQAHRSREYGEYVTEFARCAKNLFSKYVTLQ